MPTQLTKTLSTRTCKCLQQAKQGKVLHLSYRTWRLSGKSLPLQGWKCTSILYRWQRHKGNQLSEFIRCRQAQFTLAEEKRLRVMALLTVISIIYYNSFCSCLMKWGKETFWRGQTTFLVDYYNTWNFPSVCSGWLTGCERSPSTLLLHSVHNHLVWTLSFAQTNFCKYTPTKIVPVDLRSSDKSLALAKLSKCSCRNNTSVTNK